MPEVVEFGTDLAAGFVVVGEEDGERLGWSVSGAGDINNDGYDDVIFSATYGPTYVIFGSANGFADVDLGNLPLSRGFVIDGSNAEFPGFDVSAAGDVNGDGFDDVLVSGVYYNFGADFFPTAYVVFGKATGFTNIDLDNLAPTAGFRIADESILSYEGLIVSSAGDFNGDGFDDIIIGSPYQADGAGAAYVIFGKATGLVDVDLGQLSASAGFKITGDAGSYDFAGRSVAAAGDVNGDGFDDIIIGVRYGDNGGEDAGEAYVIFGKASGFGTIDLSNLAAGAGFVIQGHEAGDNAGWSVSAAGDVNGDGYDDIVIGASYAASGAGIHAGRAYVIFGKASGFGTIDLTNLAPAAGFIISGDDTGDHAGWSVAAAGDVNNDGFDDIIIGAPDNDATRNGSRTIDTGEAYLIFGRAGGFAPIDLTNLAASDGLIIQGEAEYDRVGFSVAGAGDIDGDGFDDIIVGAPYAEIAGETVGSVFVVSGRLTNLVDVESDFNGDGRSDILWRHDDGTIADWLGTGTGSATPNNASVVGVPEYWQIVGTGDFNGDRRDDLLWRGTNGEFGNWLSNPAGTFAYNAAAGIVSVPNSWQVAGVGDFNGDGRDDVLWRNDAGDVGNWLGSASGALTYNSAAGVVAAANYWEIAGVGDFNGDGRDDILWRGGNGEIGTWLANAAGGFAYNAAAGAAAAPTNWHVAGIGDFNGDNRDDIVWRSDAGEVGTWRANANGSFTANNAQVVSVSTAWHIADVGDYNGDGFDDLLWRNDSGTMTNWLGRSNGLWLENNGNALAHVPTAWEIEARDILWV